MKALEIVIEGKVQGVFFRKSAQQKAKELNVRGWTKNLENGNVQIHAESDQKEKLDQFVDWCHQGPERAKVSNVSLSEIDPVGFSDFEIKR